MTSTRLIAVGACAIDKILTVPYFPEEDSKLRTTSFSQRRGGNCPNALEVLVQLEAAEHDRSKGRNGKTSMTLIAPLPAREYSIISYIQKSFETEDRNSSNVDLSYCLYRENHTDPVTSYIFSSQATGSRTIVNHNELPEMTFEEFKEKYELISHDAINQTWVHFEGRIPEVTLQCMKYLQQKRLSLRPGQDQNEIKITVELEKPGRDGLQELAHHADVVFYSRSWAEGKGYCSANECLREQAEILGADRRQTLICTWGDMGAAAFETSKENTDAEIIRSPAYVDAGRPVVDAVGAGDTFIAGMLFGLMHRAPLWTMIEKLDFANALAGRKVLQHGFSGLGRQVGTMLGNPHQYR